MNKKCKLCGKTFNNNNYQLFGTSCFKTICELLGVVMPKNIKEIHNAEIIVEGNKNKDNKWDLNIEILDRFDFTDFIFPEEYDGKYKEINKQENKTQTQKVISGAKNGLGYTLNNMALASVQYGVLKEYDVKISFSMNSYGKEGD